MQQKLYVHFISPGVATTNWVGNFAIQVSKNKMASVQEITEGVLVSVETSYSAAHSIPMEWVYAFQYFITIENRSAFSVQLMRRRWEIFEATGIRKIVEGEGVIGMQPILGPGEKYEYQSGCNIASSIGKMRGSYQMIRLADNKPIEVKVPDFQLIAPFRNN